MSEDLSAANYNRLQGLGDADSDNPLEQLRAAGRSSQLLIRFAHLVCAATTYAQLIRLCDVMQLSEMLESEPFSSPLGTCWEYAYPQLKRYAYDYTQEHGSVILRTIGSFGR